MLDLQGVHEAECVRADHPVQHRKGAVANDSSWLIRSLQRKEKSFFCFHRECVLIGCLLRQVLVRVYQLVDHH